MDYFEHVGVPPHYQRQVKDFSARLFPIPGLDEMLLLHGHLDRLICQLGNSGRSQKHVC